MSSFSDTLIYLRKRDGISQQELANKVDISRSQIGMYETGQRMPSREVLESIADTFNVSIDFLVGRVDSGDYSNQFRSKLATLLGSMNQADIVAAGIDPYETDLIVDGAIPLTFDRACELADALGENLNSMLGIEKPATNYDDGFSEMQQIFKRLSPDNRSKLLELSRLFLNDQSSNAEK